MKNREKRVTNGWSAGLWTQNQLISSRRHCQHLSMWLKVQELDLVELVLTLQPGGPILYLWKNARVRDNLTNRIKIIRIKGDYCLESNKQYDCKYEGLGHWLWSPGANFCGREQVEVLKPWGSQWLNKCVSGSQVFVESGYPTHLTKYSDLPFWNRFSLLNHALKTIINKNTIYNHEYKTNSQLTDKKYFKTLHY